MRCDLTTVARRLRLATVAFIALFGVALAAASSDAQAKPTAAPPIIAAPIQGLAGALADRPDVSAPPSSGAASAAVPAGTWQALGPATIGPPYRQGGGLYAGPNAGRITGLATIPSGTHAGRIVAGTAGGGIWTSDDGGTTWTARSDSAANLAIGSVTVDPSNANHLIAGTGEANQCGDCFAGAGILVSTDGGTTWSLQNPSGVFSGLSVAQVAIDPSNSSHQFAATSGGLYVTTDSGTTWAKPTDSSYTSVDGNITAVGVDPSSTTTIYIGGGAATVAKSTDGGSTWAAANSGISAPGSAPLVALAIARSVHTTLYVSIGSTSAVALYKSTSSASSWTKLTSAPDYTGNAYAYGSGAGEQGWYDNVVAVDPSNANHVLAGGETVVESSDGGTTWGNVNGQCFFCGGTNKIHPDVHALLFPGDGTAWIGCDGGVYHYTPSSGAVANANGNLDITQFYYGFNVAGTDLLAGTQDNASAQTSSSSLAAWTGIFGGDGGPSAITPNSTNLRFIEANRGLYVTTDNFVSTLSNITPPSVGLFTPPEIVVPNSSTPGSPTVFYGGPDLYRTTNPTSPSWSRVTSVGQYVTAIAAAPSDSQVIYVGFQNGTIEVSTDGGSTFTALATVSSPETFVTGISVDPSNAHAISASFSYNDTRYRPGFPHVQQYLWTSTPGSGTWTEITGSGLPAAVSKVIYDNGALVAATDAGVYATGSVAGNSTAWSAVGSGLPNVQVQDLYLGSTGLYAITHGRGAWRLPLGASLAVSPSTLAAPDSVTVSWSGVNAPTSHDWIGVYHPGDANNAPLAKIYDDSCTPTAGTTALASGSCMFTVPGLGNIAGTYELRLFSNDSFTLLATSNLVTVNQGATLTVNPLSLHAGSPVTVSWSAVSAPTSHDWVGVYHPGDPNSTPLGRFYDDSCGPTAGTTALASGSCPFTVPNLSNIAGTYQLRLFSNDSFTLLATSGTVTVGPGSAPQARPSANRTARLLPLGGGQRPGSRAATHRGRFSGH